MGKVGQIERATQNRIVVLFQQQLSDIIIINANSLTLTNRKGD